jgi:hypothetical protein
MRSAAYRPRLFRGKVRPAWLSARRSPPRRPWIRAIGVQLCSALVTRHLVPAERGTALARPPVLLPSQPLLSSHSPQGFEVFEHIGMMRSSIALEGLQLVARILGAVSAMADSLPFSTSPESALRTTRVDVQRVRAAPPTGETGHGTTLAGSLLDEVFAFRECRTMVVARPTVQTTYSQQLGIFHSPASSCVQR